jgi:hypothetical protein
VENRLGDNFDEVFKGELGVVQKELQAAERRVQQPEASE